MMLKTEVWSVWVVSRKLWHSFFHRRCNFSEKNLFGKLFSNEEDRYMKPLLPKDLPSFVKRFGNFVDAEIRAVEVLSPRAMKVVIACQDSARGFDWLTISLEFNNITDARLIDDSKLSLIDMNDGMSLIYENSDFAWSIGNYHNLSGMKNATSYIISSSIKYEEGLF